MRGTDGTDKKESAGRDDQRDPDGEGEQRPSAPTGISQAHSYPGHQGQGQHHIQQGNQPTQCQGSRSEVAIEVLPGGHLRLAPPGEEQHQGDRRDEGGDAVLDHRETTGGRRIPGGSDGGDHHATTGRGGDQRDLTQSDRDIGPLQRRVDQQGQRRPIHGGHYGKATEGDDHGAADHRLLVDQPPPDPQPGRHPQQAGDDPDDQPNASPRRTWTIEARSLGSRPRRYSRRAAKSSASCSTSSPPGPIQPVRWLSM